MYTSAFQYTLRREAGCSGVGLHSGAPVRLRLLPGEEHTGIVFCRTDLGSGPQAEVLARYDQVRETRLGTTIANAFGVKVATIEHLMAAFWGLGIDNAVVELDGPEVPIMDGSSAPFVALLEQAGTHMQAAPRRRLVVDRAVTVQDGDASAMLLPEEGFVLDVEIEFPHRMIARQRACYDFSFQSFKHILGPARTFGFASEVEQLRAVGLARGGSLENAIVVGDDGVLNQEGLRFDDEFVRHKALDCLGDFFLAGLWIEGRVVTRKPGHALNNKLLRTLFARSHAWHIEEGALDDAALPAHYAHGAGVPAVAGALMRRQD